MDGSTFSPPYPGNQSISLESNFNNQPAGFSSPLKFQTSTGWSVNNQDPITGQYEGLPEPGSAALLVCGGLLVAAGGLRRKIMRQE